MLYIFILYTHLSVGFIEINLIAVQNKKKHLNVKNSQKVQAVRIEPKPTGYKSGAGIRM